VNCSFTQNMTSKLESFQWVRIPPNRVILEVCTTLTRPKITGHECYSRSMHHTYSAENHGTGVLFLKYAPHLLGLKSRDRSVTLEVCTTLTQSKITGQECVKALIDLMTWTLGEVIALANNILSQNKNKNVDAYYHYRKCTFIRFLTFYIIFSLSSHQTPTLICIQCRFLCV
jgi:hypothetical protein